MLHGSVLKLSISSRWPAMGIHGDKSQQERDWVLNGRLLFMISLKCNVTRVILIIMPDLIPTQSSNLARPQF